MQASSTMPHQGVLKAWAWGEGPCVYGDTRWSPFPMMEGLVWGRTEGGGGTGQRSCLVRIQEAPWRAMGSRRGSIGVSDVGVWHSRDVGTALAHPS